MRPTPGGDALSSSTASKPRSRKSSVDLHVPTTFVMKRVEDLEHTLGSSQALGTSSRKRANTYGVQSLADTLQAAFGPDSATASKKTESSSPRDDGKKNLGSESRSYSAGSEQVSESIKSSPLRKLKRKLSGHGVPTPATLSSVDVPSPVPAFAVPSPSRSASMLSLKLSDEESAVEDTASQAITSSEEEEDGENAETKPGAPESFPQLVMPSIQMPTRRPFSTKGKAMGKLKVMIAGGTGTGKSSLIRSIVQVCEDIVHVDPLSPSQSLSQSLSQSPPPKAKSRQSKAHHLRTTRITEIHASTKPYPHWWTDVEDSRVLRRRKSSLDAVLERNICFVDTPGYTHGVSEKEDMDKVVDYVESLLYQTASVATLEDSDVLGVVSGSGGVSIDVVLYLLPPNQDLARDIDFMQRLSSLTNVIPVIAKSDTLSAQQIVALKTSILARLQTTSVRPFFFGKALDDAILAVQGLPIPVSPASPTPMTAEPSQYPFTIPTYPYSISSTLGTDSENMDASLLMSPDYVQPLLPSELSTLVNQVFDPESIAWLRHSAAKKFLTWRRRVELLDQLSIPQAVQQPHSPTTASVGLHGNAMNASTASSIFSAASPSGVLVPRSGSSFFASNLPSPLLASSPSLANSETLENPGIFSLARYTGHVQAESHPSELRIAKWATDLQRSLRSERDRYEDLQRKDRAKWLLERVNEENLPSFTVAAPGSPRADWAVVRHRDEKQSSNVNVSHRYAKFTNLDSRDPLGLCNFSDEVKRRGFVLVKVLGGISVLGAVVVAIVRACDIDLGLPQDGWWAWITGGAE